ncbi:MAG TPA: hypothetical protein VG371_13100 [Solirubrobacteraceae bacterium]|jgi:hypothetical protein|nr:hypothetical protein [Solirubrobacteraceae bacterium]
MRRGLLIVSSALLGILALVAPIAAAVAGATNPSPAGHAADTALTPVHVRPATGGPRSAFAVSLRIPTTTGTSGQYRRTDSLTVTGPRRTGCVWRAAMGLPAGAAGSTVRVRLVPGRLGGHWCAGRFQGVVTESQSVICGPNPARACPLVMIASQTIGRFRFRVRG